MSDQTIDYWKQRAKELEADDTLQSLAQQCGIECARAEKAEAERDAIEVATIERAIEAVEWFRNVSGWDCDDVIARILALKPPPSTSAQEEEEK